LNPQNSDPVPCFVVFSVSGAEFATDCRKLQRLFCFSKGQQHKSEQINPSLQGGFKSCTPRAGLPSPNECAAAKKLKTTEQQLG